MRSRPFCLHSIRMILSVVLSVVLSVLLSVIR